MYAPNSFGGPVGETAATGEGSWENDGPLVRALHSQDSDLGQAGTLYRDVFDDAAKTRFVATLTGQGSALTIPAIRERFFDQWTNVDAELGSTLRTAVIGLVPVV